MKIKTECVPCLIKRIIFESKECTDDEELQTKTVQNACRTLSEFYDPNSCSAYIATQVHRTAYETLGDSDPYKELKTRSNKIASGLVKRVQDLIEESDDPLKTSIICSIIGNMMDFGIAGGSSNPENLKEVFDKTFKDGLGHDDTDELKKLISKAKTALLFTDNCGEIVFDKILCRQIKNFNPDLRLTLVVKGEPVLSDATIEDAHMLKFDEVVDEILTTGCFAVGVNFSKMPIDLKKRLDNTDLIICKGMANYEAFSETDYHPIVYLMRTKCNAIASSMNLPLNANVVKLYK